MRVLQYKKGSNSAKSLAEALGCKRVNREGSSFKNNYNHTILNWGCSSFDNSFPVHNWINHPDAVKVASNKLSCFKALSRVIPDNIPSYIEGDNNGANWVNDVWLGEGEIVVARTCLTGHSGKGIEIYDPSEMTREEDGVNFDEFNFNAPLYVKYIKKSKEFRVHVINGRVVDVQEKRKRRSVPNDEVDYRVRNLSGGWVYCRSDVDDNSVLCDLAVTAVKSLHLDFGAVDIIYNKHYDKFYILEVNTACGLEGSTIDTYAEHLREWVDSPVLH